MERAWHQWSARLLALAVAGVFALLLSHVPNIMDGEVYETSIRWAPTLDLALSLRLDGLALLFALLITGIGSLILLYAGDYLPADAQRGRFFLFLLLFMASMLGVVLSDNLIALFVFWELTSITSFMLIGFEHGKQSARLAAQQALVVTGIGGLALLAGLLLLGVAADAWTISALAQPGVIDASDGLVIAAFWLVLAGAVTKSAQFPFHAWLPGAMAAPTPVSAYLHSATMVKAGVFLLARMHPVLGDVAAWGWALPAFGGATMVVGAVIAIRETDLKRVLAYSTVSALGTMVFLIGMGTGEAMIGVTVLIVAHALYKAALFMVAGGIDHSTGTRDRNVLGGLRSAMPLTAAAAVLAAISMAGLPPAAGFLAKETLFEVTTHAEFVLLLSIIAAAVGALTLIAAGMVVVRPFFGRPLETPHAPHEGGVGLWVPPLLLGLIGIIGGVLTPLGSDAIRTVAESMSGTAVEVKVSFWHGFNLVLLLSVLAIGAGILGLWKLTLLLRVLPLPRFSGEGAFVGALVLLNRIALLQTRLIQSGSLRRYVIIILISFVLGGMTLLIARGGVAVPEYRDMNAELYAVSALLVVTALAAAFARSRLYAVAALGAGGFGMALLFTFFSAPDVAMTQVLVDTLVVVLFVAVFRHLPSARRTRSPLASRIGYGLVACAVGVTTTVLTWTALTVERSTEVSDYYVAHSVSEAHGRNVVNVILVDFRALDTMGEITVLAVAALGIIALLRLKPQPRDEEEEGA